MSQRQQPASSAPAAASAKSKVVFNPYAKKKSTAAAPVPAPATATNSTSKNPYSKPKRSQGETQQQRKRRPPPVNESTTFSQAFGDPDAQFGEEERAQQDAFDESALASTIGNASTDAANNNSTNDVSPRDHHTMLQPHMLHISTRQRGNPILAHIRNVPSNYSAMVPDYIFAPTRCGLFLSLRYHNLHPNYIHRRIAELKSDFEYRMLLCYVDIEDNTSPLLFLNDMCVQNNFTLMLAWSEEEAARYLETVTAFDGQEKEASIIRGKPDSTETIDQASHALKAVRSINNTDSIQLLNQFGSFKKMTGASVEELSVCPGVGPKKVRRLYEAFHRPFSTEMAKKRKEREKEKKDKEVTKEGGDTQGGKKEPVTAKKE
ncbi:hypothetical protein ACHAXR_013189 [Thalassiosira sp. AJA248-18]